MKKVFLFFLLLSLTSIPFVSASKQISLASLEGKSLQDLYLMRNEIYARHGRPFKTRELDVYFKSQNWYRLDLAYTDSRLTKTDLENIAVIKQKETEMLKRNWIKENGKLRVNTDNIINRWQYGELKNEDLEKLSQNGFIVVPGNYEQLFFIYENNNYLGIASFITTDTVMQLYHAFYDMILRKMEAEKLYPKISVLTEKMLSFSNAEYKASKNSMIKEAAFRNKAYFTVAKYLLDKKKPVMSDANFAKIVQGEIKKCEVHQDRAESGIFNPEDDGNNIHGLDYTQFVPRGHYTRSDDLKKYFNGMMWYGLNYFKAENETDLLQALLITEILYKEKEEGKRLIDLWMDIYEPTVFFVGTSNDLGPADFHKITSDVWGKNYKIEDLANSEKLKKAYELAEELYKKIKIKIELEGISNKPQFRFMGQRYIPDTEILQKLSKWPERSFPKGLDVMAVMDSKLAKKILLDDIKEGDNWKKYPDRLNDLTEQFGKLTESEWKQNLYYHWFWCLKSLLVPDESYKYPFFMNNDAWGYKSINSVLASWAELRHDSILYGAQGGAECGDGEEWVPDPTKGFVEPNYTFYSRMEELIKLTNEGLHKRNLMPKDMTKKLDQFLNNVQMLKKISLKELQGKPLTLEEYQYIMLFGGIIEHLTLSIYENDGYAKRWFELVSEVDRNMALIADVHTSQSSCLEEGVGPAFEIYTVIEADGYLKLTRGAVFSYYEFVHPSSDRLTDEKWQQTIKNNSQPPLPEWTKYFISVEKERKLPKKFAYEACSGIY